MLGRAHDQGAAGRAVIDRDRRFERGDGVRRDDGGGARLDVAAFLLRVGRRMLGESDVHVFPCWMIGAASAALSVSLAAPSS